MKYVVIETGSKGNCTVIEDRIMIDIGVSYKKMLPYANQVKVVLLTHIHSDHFNPVTIRKLSQEHPTIKFICCKYLVEDLIKIVPASCIYVLEPNKRYDIGLCVLSPFNLYHDVPNVGWRIQINGKRCIYATDTTKLDVSARNYDLYLIEANYDTIDILDRIHKKQANGEFIYEYRAMKSHMSKQQCDQWLSQNKGPNSEVVYMHQHKE